MLMQEKPAIALLMDNECASLCFLKHENGVWKVKESLFGGYKELTLDRSDMVRVGNQFKKGRHYKRQVYIIYRSLRGKRYSGDMAFLELRDDNERLRNHVNRLIARCADYESRLGIFDSLDRTHKHLFKIQEQYRKIRNIGYDDEDLKTRTLRSLIKPSSKRRLV